MAKTLVGALALAALPSAFAFRDTSPFFLFSTADLSIAGNDASIAQSPRIHDQVAKAVEKCPSETYFVVRQEGVSSADYLDHLSAQRLSHYMGGEHADVKSTMAVSDVAGTVDASLISEHLQTKCGADILHVDLSAIDIYTATNNPRLEYPAEQLVVYITMPTPHTQRRADILNDYDNYLDSLITRFDSSSYTVIYTTTARSEAQMEATLQDQLDYESEDLFGEAVHMELKRDMVAHIKRASVKEGALFERYQYLSPGLFMGISAMIPLVIILYVGLTAITNLEVSYFAFSKEMGPAAQRKQ